MAFIPGLSPRGSESPKVQEVIESVKVAKATELLTGKTITTGTVPAPFAPTAKGVIAAGMHDIQATRFPDPPPDVSKGGGGLDVNTIFEGALAGLTPGLYIIDQTKDVLTGEGATIIDIGAQGALPMFGAGGLTLSMIGGATQPGAADPKIPSLLPDLGELPKFAAIGAAALAGIWLLGKYIGRKK